MKRIRQVILGLALFGALGFGASQAVANPELGPEPRVCDPRCKDLCQGFGGELRHWGCLCCG